MKCLPLVHFTASRISKSGSMKTYRSPFRPVLCQKVSKKSCEPVSVNQKNGQSWREYCSAPWIRFKSKEKDETDYGFLYISVTGRARENLRLEFLLDRQEIENFILTDLAEMPALSQSGSRSLAGISHNK
jgi:hypothetical protein